MCANTNAWMLGIRHIVQPHRYSDVAPVLFFALNARYFVRRPGRKDSHLTWRCFNLFQRVSYPFHAFGRCLFIDLEQQREESARKDVTFKCSSFPFVCGQLNIGNSLNIAVELQSHGLPWSLEAFDSFDVRCKRLG